MAKMGLSVRDDPKKVVDVAGRAWGEPVKGLALSVLLTPKEDPDELPAISVAIHNRAAEIRRLHTRGWLSYFQISVTDRDGAVVPLTPYGVESMRPERQPALSEIAMASGEAIEADIPIGSIFQMRKGKYRVQASCEAPGGELVVSNEVLVHV